MKSINLTSSNLKSVSIERDGDAIVCTVVGMGLDADGNEYSAQNTIFLWEDLPQQVQVTGNVFMAFLSREFNKAVANEDVETW